MKRNTKKITFDVLFLALLSISFLIVNVLPIFGPITLAIYLGRSRVRELETIRLLRNYFFPSLLLGETLFWIVMVGNYYPPSLFITIVWFFSTFISLAFFFIGSHWYKPKDYTISYHVGARVYQ